MVNYKDGKIYKIYSKNDPSIIYIGSTCQSLNTRKRNHMADYRCFKNGKGHYLTSYKVIEKGDIQIELLQECPSSSKKEILEAEGKHILQLDCVNRNIAGRNRKEYYNQNQNKRKEKQREYNKENKDTINEKNKERYYANKSYYQQKNKNYRSENKERLNQKSKEYRQEHLKELRLYDKLYYQKNKDRKKKKAKEYYQKNKEEILKKASEYNRKKRLMNEEKVIY